MSDTKENNKLQMFNQDTQLAEIPKISVLVPFYNEAENIEPMFKALKKVLTGLVDNFELVVVDDGSTDKTWENICKLNRIMPQCQSIRLSRNFGKEYALAAGLEKALGEAVIIMDGDLQHPPEVILELVATWESTNADIVEAVKEDRGNEGITDRIFVNMFYAAINRLSGFNMSGASDFKLLSRKVVDAWKDMKESNLFFRGMSAWLGFQTESVYFRVPDRQIGDSKWSKFKLFQLATTAVTAFSTLPLQIVTFLGVIFLGFAFILTIQTLINWLTNQAVSGFTTVIILLLMMGSALMISLGIIGEYIARIYSEVKRRPRYVIKDYIISNGTNNDR